MVMVALRYRQLVVVALNVHFSGVNREGGGARGPPRLKNHKNIGFLSNTGPDPLKNHKAINVGLISGIWTLPPLIN